MSYDIDLIEDDYTVVWSTNYTSNIITNTSNTIFWRSKLHYAKSNSRC